MSDTGNNAGERAAARVRFHDTAARKVIDFTPAAADGRVGMYVCGMTVYGPCHLGHARSIVTFDTVRRILEDAGYRVTLVCNFTDIDDKIIRRAAEEGCDWRDVAERYINEFFMDMDALGVKRADYYPRATAYIPKIVEMVRKLLEKGHAYEVDGDVYFDVTTYDAYGSLSGRSLEELRSGYRIEADERLRQPMDFALWKASKEGEPAWESPWGPGRPGWHIECSAMSLELLGEEFDIHAGGIDLVFPHHENEIAQSVCATGGRFARHWLHCNLLTLGGKKMSKSLGNVLDLKELLRRYDPRALRHFILSTTYRTPLNYSEEFLEEAAKAVKRIDNTFDRIGAVLREARERRPRSGDGEGSATFLEFVRDCERRWRDHLRDDFNTAAAIGVMFELCASLNRFADESGAATNESIGALIEGRRRLKEMVGLLGYEDCETERKGGGDDENLLRGVMDLLVEMRSEARKRRDFATADAIRDRLAALGVELRDSKEGTTWKRS